MHAKRRSLTTVPRFPILTLLCVLAFNTPAVPQDHAPRHGFWLDGSLGFGPARFTCDSCDYHRATATNSSQVGGWNISFGLGGTPSPRCRVGAEYRGWLHGLKDSLPEIELITLLVAMYAHDNGGPFLEVGGGFSNYSLVQGTGDPIEPVSKTATSFVSGHGFGFTLGAGWEFQSEVTPRITYSFGREGALDAASGRIAKGWSHQLLLLEVGFRGGLHATDRHLARRRAAA